MCLLTWIIELLTEPYIYILEVLKLKSYETFHNLTNWLTRLNMLSIKCSCDRVICT